MPTRPARVVQRDAGISVYTAAGQLRPLHRAELVLHFTLRPTSAGRTIVGKVGDRAWIDCEILGFGVGYRGEEGWSSALGDDSISVIDQESLRELKLMGARLVSLSDLKLLEAEFDIEPGGAPRRRASSKVRASQGRGLFGHIEAQEADNDCAYFTAGLPDEEFGLLLQECLAGRVGEIDALGVGNGWSTAPESEIARDVVLEQGEQVRVTLDMVAYHVDLYTRPQSAEAPSV